LVVITAYFHKSNSSISSSTTCQESLLSIAEGKHVVSQVLTLYKKRFVM